MSLDARDNKRARTILNEYLTTQKDIYTKENLMLIRRFTNSSEDTGFAIMMRNPEKVDTILGKGTAEEIISNIIYREEVSPILFPNHVLTQIMPNWKALQRQVAIKYPTRAAERAAYAQVVYFREKTEWNSFVPAVNNYMNLYSDKATVEQMNQFAWIIFENCNDVHYIEKALQWSKQSFAENNAQAFIDTYANLLFKAGKKQEAINWESKALALAKEKKDPSIGAYERTLSEMKV
jgi:hypothetical protein